MASIVKRNNRYCVVYTYKHTNGTLKQKWETFTDLADAKNRKKEVEYKESVGTFVAPQCRTLKDLLKEYVTLYGRTKWALSTYQSNTALISNYIEPLIGSMKLQDLTTRVIEGYYQRLLKYEAVDPMCGKRQHQYVSPGTVRSVHKILRSAFEQAVKWELMEKNPCIYATLPKYTAKKRDIWTAETLFHALEVCDDPRLRLCINLSFSCSLRLGELLGLTWDCVDISPESIEAGRASIYINKELQRVDIASLNALENKNVITRFPSLSSRCTTVQVLKSPKTDSSIRTIFLPKTVAEMLVHYKAEQDMTKDALGAEYADYNLVVAGPLGMPTEQSTINGALKQLIEENDLPKVVFHSFRHSSITYKLKLNGGDIKKSKISALFGAGLRKTQSIRSGFQTCLIRKNTGDPAADAVVIYRLTACAALLKKEALDSLSWIIFWQCFRFYPTLCRLSSRILSAIIAMNSELVGLPRRLWMV